MAPYFHVYTLLQSFLLIYVLTTGIRSSSSSRQSLSHDEECLALFQFKQSITYQDFASIDPRGFPKVASWELKNNASDRSTDCCLWDGVECSEEDSSHVISLDLSSCFLYGPIDSSSTIFSLVHLQMLNLADNYFVGSQIPSTVGRLKKLRNLNLSHSEFSGQIPNEISQLTQLASLDLSANPLKLHRPSFKHLLRNLTGLEVLSLSKVDINSPVPGFLANFSSLRSINLEDCRLQDEFPPGILHLPQLKILNVEYNDNLKGFLPEFRNNLLEHLELSFTGFSGNIPESISNLKYLIKLDLSRCLFSGHLPSSIANMTQLNWLTLDDIGFTGRVPSLVSLSELTILALSDNKFERGHMPIWFGKLTKLTELYITSMSIHGEIPTFLANLTQLSILSMYNNFVVGHIPSSFINLTQLTVLDLSCNQLQGPSLSLFSSFKNLEHLLLNDNQFSGRVDLDMFIGLNKLKKLLLGYNRISFLVSNNYTNGMLPELRILGLASCNLREFPAFLHFQDKLMALFVDHNKIDGLIPAWIWNNSKETLQTVDLSYNYLTGFHQHPHILPWVRLETLIISHNMLQGKMSVPPQTTVVYDVSNNNLTGEISPMICEVRSLQLLDLSNNNMTGTLPPCLGKLSNFLSVLDLKGNNFHGRMMNTFTHGSLLKRIDLSKNHLEGQVPKSLTNCTNLEVLSLGENSFNDVFPFWLGTVGELQVLILRSNKFHGAIERPSTVISQFPKLRIIDLSNNHFSGRMPQKYFQTWNAMKSVYASTSFVMQLKINLTAYVHDTEWPYSMTLTNKGVNREYTKILNIFTVIDLSSNKFEGEIPESLGELQGLESLNLSNNHLTGHVSPSLGNLKNLESLDLSQNGLSGEIPQQFLQLGFLAVFNVSYNHLGGRIPQGKQFNTFENNSYVGNPGLCGEPLSKKCGNSKASTPPPASNDSESFFPNGRVDWFVISLGVASGLVIGMVLGNYITTRHNGWFVQKRKEKPMRPRSITRN